MGITAGASAPEVLVREVVSPSRRMAQCARREDPHRRGKDGLQAAPPADRLGLQAWRFTRSSRLKTLAELIARIRRRRTGLGQGHRRRASPIRNWLIETSGSAANGKRFILTMYERRIELEDLPFFLGLLDHLAAQGCPVPRTIHDRSGASSRMLRWQGRGPDRIPARRIGRRAHPAQARNVGRVLAEMHRTAMDFPGERAQQPWSGSVCTGAGRMCCAKRLREIDPGLPAMARCCAGRCTALADGPALLRHPFRPVSRQRADAGR